MKNLRPEEKSLIKTIRNLLIKIKIEYYQLKNILIKLGHI